MSFAIYIIGFLIFIGGIAWGLAVAGVPAMYIAIGCTILVGIALFTGATRTRTKDSS